MECPQKDKWCFYRYEYGLDQFGTGTIYHLLKLANRTIWIGTPFFLPWPNQTTKNRSQLSGLDSFGLDSGINDFFLLLKFRLEVAKKWLLELHHVLHILTITACLFTFNLLKRIKSNLLQLPSALKVWLELNFMVQIIIELYSWLS